MENGLASSIGEQNANRFLCNAKLCKKGAWRNACLDQTRHRHKKMCCESISRKPKTVSYAKQARKSESEEEQIERVGNPMRRKEDAKTNMVRGGTAIPKTDNTYHLQT